jgi:hypothetical protein
MEGKRNKIDFIEIAQSIGTGFLYGNYGSHGNYPDTNEYT